MLFPHLGNNLKKKAYFLGHMTKKLLKTFIGVQPYDNRDSFLNKKVESSGELLAQLFRSYFTKFINDIKLSLDKDITAFNIGVNAGKDAGQSIMHCHIHLIPRRKGDMDNPRGGVRGVIPSKQKYNK